MLLHFLCTRVHAHPPLPTSDTPSPTALLSLALLLAAAPTPHPPVAASPYPPNDHLKLHYTMLAWPNGGDSMLTTTGGMAPTLKFLRLCGFVIEFWVEILFAGDLRLGVTAQADPLLFSRKAELSK